LKKRSKKNIPAPEIEVQLKNYLKVVCALLVWSTWGVIIKFMQLDALHMVFFTTLFSLPPILIIAFFQSGTVRENLAGISLNYKILFCLALSLLLNNFFYFAAFNRTSIAISVFTHYTAPLFVALLAPLMLAEKFDRRLIFPLGIASLGLAFILAPGWHVAPNINDLFGALCGTVSGLAYAFTLIFAKRLTSELKMLALVFGQSLFIILCLLPFIFINPDPGLPFSSWLWLMLMGLTHCTLAPLLYISGLTHLRAQHTAIIGYIEPLAAVCLGLLLAHEIPSSSIWFGGGAIIISGTIITRLKKRTCI